MYIFDTHLRAPKTILKPRVGANRSSRSLTERLTTLTQGSTTTKKKKTGANCSRNVNKLCNIQKYIYKYMYMCMCVN